VHTHFMQFSWTEDTQPSMDLGYASNDADGYVVVQPVAIRRGAPAMNTAREDYELGGYAGM
jgi:hypothetical protein